MGVTSQLCGDVWTRSDLHRTHPAHSKHQEADGAAPQKQLQLQLRRSKAATVHLSPPVSQTLMNWSCSALFWLQTRFLLHEAPCGVVFIFSMFLFATIQRSVQGPEVFPSHTAHVAISYVSNSQSNQMLPQNIYMYSFDISQNHQTYTEEEMYSITEV